MPAHAGPAPRLLRLDCRRQASRGSRRRCASGRFAGQSHSDHWKRVTHRLPADASGSLLARFSLGGHVGAAEGRGWFRGVGGSTVMFRTIAAAAIVFAFAAFALHHPQFSGPFEEPILLLVMGSLFLLV